MSRFDWPYLIAPAFWCAVFQRAAPSASSPAPPAPSDCEPAVEVALHAVLEIDRAVLVLAPALRSTPEHVFHSRKLFFGSLSTMLGMSAGSTMTAPCCLEDRDRLGHRLLLIVVQPAARLRSSPGRRSARLVVEERARNADARALQAVAVEELRVVAARRRRALRVAGSFGSGAALSSAPSMIATSLTLFAIGPAVS